MLQRKLPDELKLCYIVSYKTDAIINGKDRTGFLIDNISVVKNIRHKAFSSFVNHRNFIKNSKQIDKRGTPKTLLPCSKLFLSNSRSFARESIGDRRDVEANIRLYEAVSRAVGTLFVNK